MISAIVLASGMIGTGVTSGVIGVTVGVVASVTTQNVQAKSFSSRSSFSRSGTVSNSSRYMTPKPIPKPAPIPSPIHSPKPKIVTPSHQSHSMIGSKVHPAPKRSFSPPVNRTWHSSPAQRVSNGSIVRPLIIGAAAGIGASMLYDWITRPTVHTETIHQQIAPPQTQAGGLQVIKPNNEFKKFEGSEIPLQYQEVMKKQGIALEPKEGKITEYSKKIKTKSGTEFVVDIADLPVLVVYINEAGKASEALFVPI